MPPVTPGAAKKSAKLKRHEEKVKGLAKPKRTRKRASPALIQAVAIQTLVNTGRPRRAQPPPVERYFVDPVYGEYTATEGATSMEVVIGPAQALLVNYGSTPDSNTPAVMRSLLSGPYSSFGWVAGHLLNDNLGGPGVAWNLTPLTTAGNKNHLTTCEAAIKSYIDRAYSRTQFNRSDTHFYGVYYKVVVGSEKWVADQSPLKMVATELRVWVRAMMKNKADGTLSAVPSTDEMYFVPLDNVAVENTGFDQIATG